jgi:cytosine/adenosine deaminase-related metal-dependent hydrolase
MAHVLMSFTESELRELERNAKETNGHVSIEWRRFGLLAHGYLDNTIIRQQLKESGVDTYSGGTPHAVSRLIGVHMAMQRMAEGAGVVPTDQHRTTTQQLAATEGQLESWRAWARRVIGLDPDAAPRTDAAMMRYVEERLDSR